MKVLVCMFVLATAQPECLEKMDVNEALQLVMLSNATYGQRWNLTNRVTPLTIYPLSHPPAGYVTVR